MLKCIPIINIQIKCDNSAINIMCENEIMNSLQLL